ncbi:CpaD family pilus assembly lipoprotein [Hyphobacterium sp. HN65]|uniref:CpaD family pilus assembly lipoprotein n=1 Tax=Hyphobacterium lacteum TaxID=3116575 RepID=A0ABU7LPF9_9PROT|nr:CpaD family pilus assembly lipoprotein [Hyphobacterium sp. HN65]MEE2525511.1 CpaD family pilus assembly lipoprotein [Hyphobacterium sp. HN65]
MRLARLALVFVPALLISACATSNGTVNAIGFPEARPVQATARMDLVVDTDANGLLWSQMGAFHAFVDHYKSNGHGPIILSWPDGSAEDDAAQGAMSELRAFLDSQGVGARFTEEGPYDARGMGNAPVIVSYMHYETEMPAECTNRRWDDLRIERMNDGYEGFGCFMAQNRAAMIGDPYHLAGPTDHDAPDSERRQTVLDTYRQGEPTSTQRRDDESGAVSTAVD